MMIIKTTLIVMKLEADHRVEVTDSMMNMMTKNHK
jgi:hypothetical protein